MELTFSAASIGKPINIEALTASLTGAFGDAFAGVTTTASNLRMVFAAPPPEDALTTIQAIIDAHDHTVLTPEQTQEATDMAAWDNAIAQIDATLELFINALANWDTLTAAQLKALQREQVKVLAALLRFRRQRR
jgi:hypothetical protein